MNGFKQKHEKVFGKNLKYQYCAGNAGNVSHREHSKKSGYASEPLFQTPLQLQRRHTDKDINHNHNCTTTTNY